MNENYDVIVLGGGPAGLTAAIYLGRARVKTLLLDTGTIGGQTILSYSVANYPGVEEAPGIAISRTMLKQAKKFGAKVKAYAKIQDLNLTEDLKTVTMKDGSVYSAPVLILATGGIPRTLGMPSEEAFSGHGISYCATCDGDFFTDKPVAVIGGGNTALEESIALAKYASKITIVHEFDHFQAQPWVIEEVRKEPKISFLMEQDILRFEGDGKLEKVITAHKKTGEITELTVDGCFIFIGYLPNSGIVKDQVSMNEKNEIVTDEDMKTNIPGVFAAGDVRAKRFRQITTAVSDGTVAALSAVEFLGDRH